MRTRKVSLWKILLFWTVGALTLGIKDGREAWDYSPGNVLISLMPGLFLLAAGRISGWAAGPADGLVVMGTGLYLGLFGVLDVLLASCLLTALAAGYLVIFRKKNRTYPIPFVPFLLAGTAGYLIWR